MGESEIALLLSLLEVVMDRVECRCEICKQLCKKRAGWFLPGEAEKAAELLGMEFKEFFRKYLGVDYWMDTVAGNTYVLAPATSGMNPGSMYGFLPFGACVFLTQDELCMIHDAKPYECAVADHNGIQGGAHEAVAMAWRDHQEEVNKLLC